jgi:N-acetylmuramoyl-L-alanine amidase
MLGIVGALAAAAVMVACGGDVEQVDEDAVETVDAAAAAAARAELTSGNQAPDPLSADGDGNNDGDGQAGSTGGPATTAGELATTASTYPPILEEISVPEGGVRALLTPTGVLVEVVGQTPSGWVVDTPCGGRTLVEAGQTITGADVVIDPGHGGDELGAADVPDLSEAKLNLLLARATATVLRERGVSVVLLRNADYRIPISRRAEIADRIAPKAFVSIHHNTPASRPSTDPGTEVYVQNGSPESRRLGGLLYEEVFQALKQFEIEWTARDDAGVLVVLNDRDEDAYGIARYPLTTSALVEMAYLGNPAEAELLATEQYLDVGGLALADGIERFLSTEDPGSGYIENPRRFNPSGLTGGSSGCTDPVLD